MKPWRFLFTLLTALLATGVAHACAECGGKGKASWLAREREPKASQ